MRILILTHSFNSLAQKFYAELKQQGHTLTVEYDISDQVTETAVAKFKPDLLLAPFLKRSIPESVWKNVLSLIIHPGPPGNRGPSALDWAILNNEQTWGVTVIQANEILDGGAIWAYRHFPMKTKPKGALYRQEVTDAAVEALEEALTHLQDYNKGLWSPTPAIQFQEDTRPPVKQGDRKIDWQTDTREMIFKKINSADGSPGVFSKISNQSFYLYDAKEFPNEVHVAQSPLGTPIGICDHGVILNTLNGAITIGHLKEKSTKDEISFKKSADHFFSHLTYFNHPRVYLETNQDITTIYFNFYNGAMGVKECRDLHQAFLQAKNESSSLIVFKSENDFFSNGIHLNEIEAAKIPADYAWENINTIDDLIYEIITTTDKMTAAIVDGNTAAGGVLLARATDWVFGADNIIINPHYKNMGNLYGSEFWTYLFPKYLGELNTKKIMSDRLPIAASEAKTLGIFDEVSKASDWKKYLEVYIEKNAKDLLLTKKTKRHDDELIKPLIKYREEELLKMKDNFYGFDPSFHVARYNFVRHISKSKTPLHIAIHRTL